MKSTEQIKQERQEVLNNFQEELKYYEKETGCQNVKYIWQAKPIEELTEDEFWNDTIGSMEYAREKILPNLYQQD